MIMTGTHDKFLVILSVLIAIFASFTALSLAGRIRASSGWRHRFWLSAAAGALGGGIWSMHFVAMLAFTMPGMEMGYDLPLTLLSLLIALIFTGLGLALMNWTHTSLWRVAASGLLIGQGVLAMHYIGMAAMRMPVTLRYDPLWFAISVAIAIGAATAAMWLAGREQRPVLRILAANLMGVAIAGMHYSGMRAAIFTAHPSAHLAHDSASVGQSNLAVLIAIVTISILLIALGAARFERLFEGFARREARIALRLRVADVLRERSTEQGLEEVAALMGAHFGVSRAGYDRLDPLDDLFEHEVCWTDGTTDPLSGHTPAARFGAEIVAALMAGETVAVGDLGVRGPGKDTRALLAVPFVRDGRLRTLVYLHSRTPRYWHREEITFMEEIAERARLVIERAAVEEQLRELNATLEARVEARTAELRETQHALLQSQKMEAVGQLVAGLAHDFNNVLGAIVGAFDLIGRRADEGERVRRYAEAGLQAAERGAKLTAQLLAFARSQRIQLEPLYICDVIEAMRDMLARTLGPMIALDVQLNPAPVPVLADATQIEMMVLNLAINARDAMPHGGRLRISTSVLRIEGDQELSDGEHVEIRVSDTGTGMDEATLRRAMEPFFTTKPVGKGTGLGLAQIYGSARQAGGTVRIESRAGIGTTVRVLLPCTEQRPDAGPLAAAPLAQLAEGHARVLLVDDDPDLRTMLASALDAQGYGVVEAPDGALALAALEVGPVDIVVLDFAMPGMTGAELAQRIFDRWPGLPILFASGFSDTDAIAQVAGPDARVLRKPFRIDELLRALAGALERSG